MSRKEKRRKGKGDTPMIRSRKRRRFKVQSVTGEGYRFNKCERKRQYRSHAKAKRAARMVGNGVEPYECDLCGGFHIGRKLRRRAGTTTSNPPPDAKGGA